MARACLKAAAVRQGELGQIDRLLPPPSGKPFRLPDLTVDLKDTTIAPARPTAGWASRQRVEAICQAASPQLAASSPGLALGACRLDQFRAFVDVGVTARRPQVRGPIGSQGLACPASNLRLAQPRMELDSSFSEGFENFDGRGRLMLASFQAGENGLADVVSNLTFKGTPADALGRIDLGAQQARLDRIVAGRTRFEGYRLNAGAGS